MSAEFKDRFKMLRKELDFSQIEIAKKLSINRTNISHYEQGRTIPDADTLSKIADIFNVSVDYLLGRTNVREQDNTIAAHHDGDWTESELEEIESFKAFLRSKRGK